MFDIFSEEIKDWLLALSLCTPRLVALFTFLPILGNQVLPGQIRSVVIFSLSLMIVPTLLPEIAAFEASMSKVLIIILKEALIGGLCGYIMALFFWAIQGAGFIIDNQRGSTMASSMDPMTGSQTSPLGIFLFQSFTVYFVSLGGLLLILGFIYASYGIWGVMDFFPRLEIFKADYFLAHLDTLMRISLLLASPIMIAMFLTEMGMALIGRFAPQLNVFFISMPIKSAVGIFMLIIYIELLFTYFNQDILLFENILSYLKAAIE